MRKQNLSPTGTVAGTPPRDLRAGENLVPLAVATILILLTASVIAIVLMPGLLQETDSSTAYIPGHDEEIVALLSPAVVALADAVRQSPVTAGIGGSAEAELEVGSGPRLLQQILTLYDLAVRVDNPRVYGHALALIAAWPEHLSQPTLLRIVKADILQHGHQFEEATVELEQVLAIEPRNRMALQMQPQIALVSGNLDLVGGHCLRLAQAGYATLALNCQAQLDGVTGHAEQALQALESALVSGRPSTELAFELHVTAADIARRLNRRQPATDHFLAAIRLNPANRFVIVNYAAMLLEQGRAGEAAAFLGSREGVSNSLEMQLLYVLALLESGQSGRASPLLSDLEAQIDSMRPRGPEQPHKLIALYDFHIARQFDLAHEAARANWATQKEPSDTLLYAASALAAGHHESLERLARWRTRTGLQDHRLDAVLREAGLL